LLTAFNRPSETSSLLERLRDYFAGKLYVAIDGPRFGNIEDETLVSQVKKIVSSFESDFEMTVIERPINLGCGASPREAISQVLSIEQKVVVLEDDCVPNSDFLPWMNEMLNIYAHDVTVGAVCGFQSAPTRLVPQNRIWWASRLFAGWGWGTWRRAWDGYEQDLTGWKSNVSWFKSFRAGGYSVEGMRWFRANWNWVMGREDDIWDHQFGYLLTKRNQVVVKPPVNLIENVGTNERATHTTVQGSVGARAKYAPIPPTAVRPGDLKVVRAADRWIMKNDYQARSTLAWATDLAKAALNLNK